MAVIVSKRKKLAPRGKRVFPASSSGAHRMLMSLGQDKVDAIMVRMLEGEKVVSLVDYIQQVWKDLTHIKPKTLLKALIRFRKERVDGKLLWLNSEHSKEAKELFKERVDVLENLTRLVEIQQERVTKAFLREQKMPNLMSNVRSEIDVLAKLYMQLAELQMELGFLKRVPKEHLVASVELAASRAGQILEEAIQRDQQVSERLTKAFQLLESKLGNDAGGDTPETE